MKKQTKTATKQNKEGQSFPVVKRDDISTASTILRDEFSSALYDFIRQYVGAAYPQNTPGSGIYLNTNDRVWLTQYYLELYGYDLYEEVEKDPHNAAIFDSIKLAIAGLDWDVVVSENADDREKSIALWVKDVFDNLYGFTNDFVELNDALGKGFAVSEVLWGVNEDGYVVPTNIMNRPQRRFSFDAATRNLKLRTITNPYLGEPVPEHKFIVHRTSQKWENPFGDALDQRLYWPWYFKRNVTKFFLQFLESNNAPIPIVQHPDSADKELKNEALAIAQQIRTGSYGRIPASFTVLWAQINSAQSVAGVYENAMRFFDSQSSKCVLGQELTTEASSGSGNGSRALGEVHMSTLWDRIKYYAMALQETLSQQLIKWMVDYNFNNVKHYPKLKFDLSEPTDLNMLSTVIKNLSDAGYRVDRQYIEDTLGVTLEEEQEEPKQPKEPVKEPQEGIAA